jgi:putative transcriptional regulator
MSSSLAPAFLLSMPQMLDPNFSRTVVLLCKHRPDEGALGFVVNRPQVTTGRVILNVDPPMETERELEIWIGGPVEQERSWVLIDTDATSPEASQSYEVVPNLYLSTSHDVVGRLFDPDPPPRARLIVGYSGWGRGQLEAELEASAWLMSEVDRDLIFNTPADKMWEAAIRKLGVDPAALQMSRGVH